MDQHCVQLDTDSESSGIWLVEIGRICSQTEYTFFLASLVLCSTILSPALTAFLLRMDAHRVLAFADLLNNAYVFIEETSKK